MSLERARKIADAVLYEGYLLYPYRASARKNQLRFQFGVLAPRAWSEAGGSEHWWMNTDCIVEAGENPRIAGTIRFLQIQQRIVEVAIDKNADSDTFHRDEAIRASFVGTHTILSISNGRFVSLIDPPEWARAAATGCTNVRTWPVLIGANGERDVMLSSPIILQDYPEIAPESAGDLFDST